MPSRLARKSTAPLRLEQLEHRELMAGDVGLGVVGQATGLCRPLPLSEVVASPVAAEYLESGQGNVTAELVDGVLIIRGDGFGNRFSIYGNGDGGGRGVVQVNSGHYYEDSLQEEQIFSIVPGSTLINGQQLNGGATQAVTFKGVTAIDIDLGDGDDWLEIYAIKTPQLTIRTGNGNDEVILKGMMPYQMAHYNVWLEFPRIEGPMGDMHAVPQPLRVDGDLFIDTGVGDDQLSPFAAVSGDATVNMGDGDDSYIEVPYELNQIWIEKDPVTGYYPPPERVIGKLTATGELSIDLGADQDVENIPTNWQDDPYLVSHIQNVPRALDYYRGMVERGEATPGIAQRIRLPFPDALAQIDAEGRLEIEFGFTQGFGSVIERLQGRGVTIDAYSTVRGLARAVVRAEDLKLFANLPGIGYFHTYLYTYAGVIDPEWDYVRPGSSTAAGFPEVTPIAESDDMEPTTPATTGPAFGPSQLKDVSIQTTAVSLRDWYYSTVVIGPQPLQ